MGSESFKSVNNTGLYGRLRQGVNDFGVGQWIDVATYPIYAYLMQAFEFETHIDNNRIVLPESIGSKISAQKVYRVILLNPDDEDQFWRVGTAKSFLSGYADSDSVYDKP